MNFIFPSITVRASRDFLIMKLHVSVNVFSNIICI